MLSDEELERMKPYGEAFIQEQDYMPQTTTTYPIFFLITFLYPCFWILRNIVTEKERGIRETLKTMVLSL